MKALFFLQFHWVSMDGEWWEWMKMYFRRVGLEGSRLFVPYALPPFLHCHLVTAICEGEGHWRVWVDEMGCALLCCVVMGEMAMWPLPASSIAFTVDEVVVVQVDWPGWMNVGWWRGGWAKRRIGFPPHCISDSQNPIRPLFNTQ